jgi:hypothetical protein
MLSGLLYHLPRTISGLSYPGAVTRFGFDAAHVNGGKYRRYCLAFAR